MRAIQVTSLDGPKAVPCNFIERAIRSKHDYQTQSADSVTDRCAVDCKTDGGERTNQQRLSSASDFGAAA